VGSRLFVFGTGEGSLHYDTLHILDTRTLSLSLQKREERRGEGREVLISWRVCGGVVISAPPGTMVWAEGEQTGEVPTKESMKSYDALAGQNSRFMSGGANGMPPPRRDTYVLNSHVRRRLPLVSSVPW
jgi:hypothetical protein